MTFNFNKFWHGVIEHQAKFVKKINDNRVIENVTVMSSILSQNDGAIRILTHSIATNHSKLAMADKSLIL